MAAAAVPSTQCVPDSKVRSGGGLLVAGFLCWVVNGALLLSAFIVSAVSTGDTLQTNPRLTVIRALRDPVLIWVPAVPSAVALVAGAVLLAAGLLVLRRGTVARTSGRDARDTYAVSAATQGKARVSAGLVAASAAVVGVGFVGFALSASATEGADASGQWLLVWLAASAALTVGAVLFSMFSKGLYADTGGLLTLRGSLFTDYTIANLIGLAFFGIANFASADVARLMNVLGVFSQLLFLPLTAIVVFSTLTADGLTLRRKRAFAAPVRISAPSGAADRPASGLDVGWVSGLRARVDELERVVREQRDAITQLRLVVSPQAENAPRLPENLPDPATAAQPGERAADAPPRPRPETAPSSGDDRR